MTYDRKEIASTALWQWQGDDYYILSYPPTRRRTIVTDFILDFKNNDSEAVGIAFELILSAVKKIEPILQRDRCQYVVSVPPSRAGRTNVPCEQACAAIQGQYSWLKHLPQALSRTKTVPKSAWSAPYNRPTQDDHRKTIKYAGTVRSVSGSIMMVDDVITQGNVSGACRDILIEDTSCKRVIGMFLGRTE